MGLFVGTRDAYVKGMEATMATSEQLTSELVDAISRGDNHAKSKAVNALMRLSGGMASDLSDSQIAWLESRGFYCYMDRISGRFSYTDRGTGEVHSYTVSISYGRNGYTVHDSGVRRAWPFSTMRDAVVKAMTRTEGSAKGANG